MEPTHICRAGAEQTKADVFDLLWLDRHGRLLRLDRAVKPRRMRTCMRATAVVEANAGHGERFAAALAKMR